MKGGPKVQGFTIVEVMIVLAVTGGLFVSAALLISGRQNQTEFDQAIRQIQTQIQQAANEVATGYYPNVRNFNCSAGASGPVLTAGGSEQGTSSGCIFLGKALQFKVNGTDPEEFAVYTLAGLQKNASGSEATSLAEARPVAVAPSASSPSVPDVTSKEPLQYGLTTASMRYDSVNNIGGVAFVSSLAQYNTGGTLISGSQQVNVVPISTSALDSSMATMAEVINNRLATSPVNPTGGVEVCFASGTTDQSGLITIGNNGRQLSVTLTIKGNRTCA